jgi:integrase
LRAALIVPELRSHLDQFIGRSQDVLIFTGEKGAMLKRSNWRDSVKWPESIKEADLPEGFHFHDLRHTGNHLARQS